MKRAILCALILFVGLGVLGCGSGGGNDNAGGDDAMDDDTADDDDSSQPLSISEVIPSSAGASVSTEVTLIGGGFGEGLRVTVGTYRVDEVTVISDTKATAKFPSIRLNDCGVKDVRLFYNDQMATLEGGFEYFFDEDPVVMVHGFNGGADDYDKMIEWFKELGYPEEYLAAIDFEDSTGSTIPQARDELPPFVDELLARTNREKVDVVAHSLGALTVRLWIKLYEGDSKVRDIVTVSGTNHGNNTSCLSQWWGEGAKEMCPAYADEEHSANGVQWTLNGDPDSADVDETPFGVEDGGEIYWVGALYTTADIVVSPIMSCCLNQSYRNDCSGSINIKVQGVSHNDMIRDAGVFDTIQGLLRQHNISKP